MSAAAPAGQDFAERLGAWLSVADSISLRTALQSIPAMGQTMGGAPTASRLADDLQRVRATLIQSITAPEPAQPSRGRADHSTRAAIAGPAIPLDPAAEFAMLHQRYSELQRRMEMSIDALRAHARQVLAQTSPALARLAALDAVMDQMMGGREQHLLSNVPALLKKRFEQLRREATADAESQLGAEAGTPPQTDWLAQLAAEFRQALLAELDLRLQPVAGMVEALSS